MPLTSAANALYKVQQPSFELPLLCDFVDSCYFVNYRESIISQLYFVGIGLPDPRTLFLVVPVLSVSRSTSPNITPKLRVSMSITEDIERSSEKLRSKQSNPGPAWHHNLKCR
jgi:hypothetical protein